jgi:glycosidase
VVKNADGEVVPAPVVVDPNTLPGFTSGKLLQAAPADAATLNVAKEEGDAESLLQLYRRLIQLHHDNPTLRNGAELLLDYDDLGAVVWVRQPAKDSRSTAIIAVCNLSGAPLKLSLNEELTRQHIKTGTLRNLLSATATAESVQSTDNLSLPPYGVFLGELYH